MNEKQQTKISKFLSLVLRHKPEIIGITLDENGWLPVTELLSKMNAYGKEINHDMLTTVVANNSKKRFSFSEDGQFIRANQGHSLQVNLGYIAQIPPHTLYHGTASRFVANIYATGCIQKMQRHHVHLSADMTTACVVGQRHGKLVIFEVDTVAMRDAGHEFFVSDNGVWLTDNIPMAFIKEANI